MSKPNSSTPSTIEYQELFISGQNQYTQEGDEECHIRDERWSPCARPGMIMMFRNWRYRRPVQPSAGPDVETHPGWRCENCGWSAYFQPSVTASKAQEGHLRSSGCNGLIYPDQSAHGAKLAPPAPATAQADFTRTVVSHDETATVTHIRAVPTTTAQAEPGDERLRQELEHLKYANERLQGDIGMMQDCISMKNSQLQEIEMKLMGTCTYNITAMLREIDGLQKIVNRT